MHVYSVSSCRCCMLVACMHPVAVLNSVFCMTCVVNASRGCKRLPYGRDTLQSRLHDYLVGSNECLPSCCGECFLICRGLCACNERL